MTRLALIALAFASATASAATPDRVYIENDSIGGIAFFAEDTLPLVHDDVFACWSTALSQGSIAYYQGSWYALTNAFCTGMVIPLGYTGDVQVDPDLDWGVSVFAPTIDVHSIEVGTIGTGRYHRANVESISETACYNHENGTDSMMFSNGLWYALSYPNCDFVTLVMTQPSWEDAIIAYGDGTDPARLPNITTPYNFQ